MPTGTAAETRFQRLSQQWKAESEFLSNTAQMAMLDSYQQIIGMGAAAVPLILDELRREPDQWFWVLEAITTEKPVPPQDAGDVDKMAQAWIDWGVQRGLVAEDSADRSSGLKGRFL